MRANENKANPKRSASKDAVKLLEKLHNVQAAQSSTADIMQKIRTYRLHDAGNCGCPLCETARSSLDVYEVQLADILKSADALRKELAKHPHVPNKKERRAARQAAAKKR